MGKSANVEKSRTCRLCNASFNLSSSGLKKHFLLCARAMRAGLVLPGGIYKPSRPEVTLE